MNKRKSKKLRVLERKQTGHKVQWYVKFGYYKQKKSEKMQEDKKTEALARKEA